MEPGDTETLVSRLTDLELALLLSLVAQEHCLIITTPGCIDDVCNELELVNLPCDPP
jgi:hypothetical protein